MIYTRIDSTTKIAKKSYKCKCGKRMPPKHRWTVIIYAPTDGNMKHHPTTKRFCNKNCECISDTYESDPLKYTQKKRYLRKNTTFDDIKRVEPADRLKVLIKLYNLCANKTDTKINRYNIDIYQKEINAIVENQPELKDILEFKNMTPFRYPPLYKKGDRCLLVMKLAQGTRYECDSIYDDSMIIADDDVTWKDGEWWYNIKYKANMCNESYLKPYADKHLYEI